jgi:hypothetical protein
MGGGLGGGFDVMAVVVVGMGTLLDEVSLMCVASRAEVRIAIASSPDAILRWKNIGCPVRSIPF